MSNIKSKNLTAEAMKKLVTQIRFRIALKNVSEVENDNADTKFLQPEDYLRVNVVENKS